MRHIKARWRPEPAWNLSSSDEAEKDKDGGIEGEKRVVVEVQVGEETQPPLPAPAALKQTKKNSPTLALPPPPPPTKMKIPYQNPPFKKQKTNTNIKNGDQQERR